LRGPAFVQPRHNNPRSEGWRRMTRQMEHIRPFTKVMSLKWGPNQIRPQERQWGGLAPQFRPHSSCHTALNYVRMKMEHVS